MNQPTAGIYRGKLSFEQGFTRIPNEWLRDDRISMKGKGLLAYLLSHEVGYTITFGQIERETADGRHAIRSAMDELIAAGYLAKERTHDARGWNAGLAWFLQDPNPKSENPTLENPTLENRPAIEDNFLKKKTDTRSYRQDELDGAFEEFWQVYPRKQYKQAVYNCFVKVCTRAKDPVTPQTLIEGARRLANDPNLPPKNFIPNGEKWLNQGGWENEPYPERERTPEEKAAIARAKAQADREAALAENARQRAESEKAKAEARPAPKCEHGKSLLLCRVCVKNVGSPN
jgi:hypothetical protein